MRLYTHFQCQVTKSNCYHHYNYRTLKFHCHNYCYNSFTSDDESEEEIVDDVMVELSASDELEDEVMYELNKYILSESTASLSIYNF